jgi:predicted HTH transcriptional regulator
MDFKGKMMQGMMDKFCSNMSPDEKNNMMDMMKNMMGSETKGKEKDTASTGFNPMEMCQRVMVNMEKTNELAAYATPEVRALFEEWAEQIESEILEFIKANNNPDQDKIAEKFKLSKNSINFFLARLAQKGKINIKTEAK